MKGRPLHERVGFAIAGLRAGWIREASFRTQVRFGLVTIVLLAVLRPAPVWWAVILLVSGLILALELLKSAIEATIDLLHPEIHPEVKAAKDMVSGAVMLTTIAAVGIGIALLLDSMPTIMGLMSL